MRHGRFITTALVAVAGMAIGPSVAAAAPSPLSDDSIENFAAGTAGIDTWAVEPGTVRLKPTGSTSVTDNFDGAVLGSGWGTSTPPGAIVGSGALTLDGALVSATSTFSGSGTLEFRATFGGEPNQHVGLGANLDNGPWAIFSTKDGGGLFMRTRATAGTVDTDSGQVSTIPTFNPSVPHIYRIDWSSQAVTYSVDGVAMATHSLAAPIATAMGPIASDLVAPISPANAVTVNWLAMGSFPSSGTFVSRVLGADDAHTVWGAVKETGLGSGATFETRSGKNPTFDSTWSNWEPVGSAGAIQSPSGRQYIQYKATLNSATASLDKVAIDYTTDNTPPSAAINSVDVGGTSASVSFSSPDSDIAGFECSLDGGAFAACTSPNALTGLAAGSHTASVQAIDKAANVGTPVSRTFSIASPPSSGGSAATQQPSDGSSAVDTNAPKVSVVAKSLRASKKSTVSFRVGCPATETSCKVTLKLKNGSSSAASKTVTVKGSKTVTITLTLNKATRQLLKHGSLKVSAVYTATDAAGNHTTTTKRMTLSKAAA
jgi:hypothetical protein